MNVIYALCKSCQIRVITASDVALLTLLFVFHLFRGQNEVDHSILQQKVLKNVSYSSNSKSY